MDASVSAEEFEALMLEALRQLCAKDGKPITPYAHVNRREVDALAPEGIADVPGPTVIELKRRITRTARWKRTLDFLFWAARDAKAETVLLICGEPISDALTAAILGKAAEWPAPPRFVLWGSD